MANRAKQLQPAHKSAEDLAREVADIAAMNVEQLRARWRKTHGDTSLVDATGWLPHTTRAALTGLRKRGYSVLLERQDGRPSLYRIAFSHDRKAA
jgi:hypothetical protein